MQTTRSTTQVPRYAIVDAPRSARRPQPGASSGGWTVRIAALAALYLLLGQVGIRFGGNLDPISPFWPASGLAFAFVTLYGMRAWPGIVLGSAITCVLNGAPLWAATLVGIGSALSTLAAITMARRFCGFQTSLRSVPDTVGLVIPGAALGSCIASLIGTTAYFAAGMVSRDHFAGGLLSWWVGDALGVVLVAPFLLTFADRREPVAGSLPELLLLVLLAPAVTYAAFMDRPTPPEYPFSFIVFPVVVWAALRFGVRGAASANLVVGLIALLMTRAGRGEFAGQTLPPLVGVGLFALVLATTGLFLACATSQATSVQHAMHRAEVRHREQLERRVVERTAELRTLNAELESFSYSVAHDLRGPLRTIAGFSRMVIDDEGRSLSPDSLDLLERSERAAIRMGRIVDALLGLSRINRGEIHFEDFDLTKLAVETSREVAGQSETPIEWTIQPDLRTHADPRLVRVLLGNLFENAVKFSRGRPVARVEFGMIEQDGETRYFVSDNGVGFEAAFAGKLFKPFHRLHSQDEFEGEGIGLATVERIVRRHGGRIWAEGETDRGAVFFFTLASALTPEKPWSPVDPALL
ncbi:MAG: MASE1 domain-containing protein [Fimbriimonadaceae bacterium]|nr:MASE1 domain-containing protein [Fimbriimonadaceae bacterium]